MRLVIALGVCFAIEYLTGDSDAWLMQELGRVVCSVYMITWAGVFDVLHLRAEWRKSIDANS